MDIQGLRAVAVLAVLVFHASPAVMPGGFVGVDVFFVISGFVITAMLQREWAEAGRIRLARFYWRRFRRLMPALAMVVLVTTLLSAFILSPLGTQQTTAATGLGAILLAANLVIARTTGGYFDGPAETNALLHTWSLSVEEQFYLFFPLLLMTLWLLAGRSGRRRSPIIIVSLVGLVSFALAVAGSSGYQPSLPPRLVYLSSLLLGFYSPLTRTWEFAAGAVLALATHRLALLSPRTAVVLGSAGAFMLAASLGLITGTTPFPGVWALLPVTGTMLLIVAGTIQEQTISRTLSSRPLVRIGDWSYSLYLWHWPPIVFARVLWPGSATAMVVAALVSVIPALISYYYLERPIRSMRPASRFRAIRLVAITTAPPVILAATLGVAASQGFWLPQVQRYQNAILPDHAGTTAGCSASVPWENVQKCTWNATSGGSPIYLVGDSHAEHFSEGVIEAGRVLDRPVINLSVNGCPFSSEIDSDSLCGRLFGGGLSYLTSSKPGLVILSNATTETSLTATVSRIQSAGHKVLIIAGAPVFDGWRPDMCSAASIQNSQCKAIVTLEAANSARIESRMAIEKTAQETGATVIDVLPHFCEEGSCSTEAGGTIRYRDEDHITVEQSRALADDFRAMIAASG